MARIEPEDIGLDNLTARSRAPARPASGVGRGQGSGMGKTSGRGHKGAGRPRRRQAQVRLEGGQNPIHMRMRKLRGPNKKMSMPFEPFRTHTQPVNLATSRSASRPAPRSPRRRCAPPGLATRKHPVKILGHGELSRSSPSGPTPSAPPRRRRSRPPAAPAKSSSSSVLQTIANAFAIPEIRRKISFTAAMLALYRLGAYIPAPGIDVDRRLRHPVQLHRQQHPRLPEPVLAAAAAQRLSLFALGIMPYITASIILQLLTVVVPSLEQLCRRRARSASRRSPSTRAT